MAEPGALLDIHRLTGRGGHGAARSMATGGHRHDAADAWQEAWCRLLATEAARRPQRHAQLVAWLVKASTNVTHDEHRRRVRAQAGPREAWSMHQAMRPPPLDPAEHAQRGEVLQCLRRAIDRLGDEMRQLLALRYVDGLSFGEIASRTGLSANAAQLAHARCLRWLRRELADAWIGRRL